MLQYHPRIVRSKASLGSSREVEQDCGVSFVNYLYLVPLIIGQNFCTTSTTNNQTGPCSWECCGRGRVIADTAMEATGFGSCA